MAVSVLPLSAVTGRGVQSGFTTEVRVDGTRTVLVLGGDADFSTSPVLADALSRLVASGTEDVIIDLGQAAFIDSATARTFATAHGALDQQGRKLSFRSPSRLAVRVLDLFGMTAFIEAADGPE